MCNSLSNRLQGLRFGSKAKGKRAIVLQCLHDKILHPKRSQYAVRLTRRKMVAA